MIQNETDLKKKSFKTGLVGLVITALLSLILKDVSLLGGYALGFGLSLLILFLNCKSIDLLLSMQLGKTSFLQGLIFLFKMGIYAMGFFIAVKVPGLINIFTVAIGYLTIKLTIYRLAMTRR